MDLRYRGAPDLAEALLEGYFGSSSDTRLPALLRFYESYRAYVRGKVRSFVLDQPGPSAEEKAAATDEARRFFDLSTADARRLRPRLVLLTGLMGTGKTRQADELGRRAGVPVWHSDVVRKRLAGLDPTEERRVPFGTDIYAPEWTEKTYDALIEEARTELSRGNSVILDASWSRAEQRARARRAAGEREALFAVIECTASDEALRARLSRPDRSITDGRIELLDDQRAAYEHPQDGEADLLLRIDTSGDFEPVAERAYQSLFA